VPRERVKALDAHGHSTGTDAVNLVNNPVLVAIGNVRAMSLGVGIAEGFVSAEVLLLDRHETGRFEG
jgi:hypothetical protein